MTYKKEKNICEINILQKMSFLLFIAELLHYTAPY